MESTIEFFKNENKDYYKGKNIIITGATGGIGSVLVNTLSSLEANLLLISHNEEKINKIFYQSINKLQYEIINLEDPKEINLKFTSCLKKLKGKLDNLLICHGIYSKDSIQECSIENFDKLMNINVRSIFHILSLSVPFLKLSKGNCVIISSMESLIPVKNGFLNTTTKCMINSLVHNSALELAYFGVRINAVAPGITNTKHRENNSVDNIDGLFKNFDTTNNKGDIFPLNKRILNPENIVDTILFLGSDEASFITGEIIQNDNGYGLNHDLSFTHNI